MAVRVEQADGDGDCQIGVLVIGHGQHAPAFRVFETGQHQHFGLACIGGEGRRIGLEILEIEFLNPLFVLFQHDEGLVAAVERMGDQATRLATAADQVKRFFQQANAPVEAIGRQRVLKTLVLQQRDQRHHRVRPADHCQVDADGDPHPLGIGKGIRDFAEANRRCRIADEIESVEKAEWRCRLACGVNARDQRQADDGDAIKYDQQNDRRPHAP